MDVPHSLILLDDVLYEMVAGPDELLPPPPPPPPTANPTTPTAAATPKLGLPNTEFEIIVSGAKNKDIATNIAKSVANSPLVKTAIYGEDPNWGRVIAAIGKSYEEINHEALGLFFGEHKIISGGMALDNYNEEIVKQYMKKDEIQIIIDLGMGSCDHTVWTCDFSHKYIDINTDYRS